jgi:mRNA interferase RelE/StbE
LAWTIEFTETAKKQLAKTDRATADRITAFMRDRVATADDPRSYGHALTGDQKGRWRFRVGDYRLICELHYGRLIVVVLFIGHRGEVYR